MLSQPLLSLLLASSASAQIIDNISFGQNERISPNGRGLPGWSVLSENNQPQLLSDRIILTPPVPAGTRGALWADNAVTTRDWTVDFEFRTNGQDQGSGNLQLWLTKEKKQVETNSIYTVEKFDGLAIVIDQYGGRGGSIRGFLNDGSQNFKSHASVEALAFGHCDYSYRNLGRTSKLRVTSQNGLTVSIDDRVCFSTNRIDLPSNYFFGITAATSESPDSFEVYKFIASAASNRGGEYQSGPPVRQHRPNDEKLNILPGSPEVLPDSDAESLKSQNEQFTDLHNRLQGLTHQVADMYALFDIIGKKIDERHQEIAASVVQHSVSRDVIDRLDRRIENIERNVDRVLKDVESKDYRVHLTELQSTIDSVKGGLTDHLPATLGESEFHPVPSIPNGSTYANSPSSCHFLRSQDGQVHCGRCRGADHARWCLHRVQEAPRECP
jgi:mannose-binding lectin 1